MALLVELPEPVRRIWFHSLGGADGHAVRRACRQFYRTSIASGACLRVNLGEPGRVAPADPDGDDVAPPWWQAATRVELCLVEGAELDVDGMRAAVRRLAAACPNVGAVRLVVPRECLRPVVFTACRVWPGLTELAMDGAYAPAPAPAPAAALDCVETGRLLVALHQLRQLRRLVLADIEHPGLSVDCGTAQTIGRALTQLVDLELAVRLSSERRLCFRGRPDAATLRASQLRQCTAVTLEYGSAVQKDDWPALQALPQLHELRLSAPTEHPPAKLQLTSLTRLRIDTGTAAVQAAVAVACPGLTAARLRLTADGLAAVAAACPQLTDLELAVDPPEALHAEALGGVTLPRLRRLQCKHRLFAAVAEPLAAACPALEDASLWLTPAAMAAVLRACPRLTALDVLLARDGDGAAPHAALHVPHSLRSLQLAYAAGVDLAPVLGPVARAAHGAPVRLRLWNPECGLGPAELEAVASGAFVLEDLGCRPDEATLLALAEAAAAPRSRVQLCEVALHGQGVTDRAFVALCRASPSLTAVTLRDTARLTDAALAEGLAALGPRLRAVDVRFDRPHLATARCLPAIRGACPWARVQFRAAKAERPNPGRLPGPYPQPPTDRC